MMDLRYIITALLLMNFGRVESASLLERSYEYVVSIGKSMAPNFVAFLDCLGEEDPWVCTKQKAAKMLDTWEVENDKERSLWRDAADTEVLSSGRSNSELPSKLGNEVETSLESLADAIKMGVARATGRKKGGGIDTITISAAPEKKKDKKKKNKPPKIHLIHAAMMATEEKSKGRGFQQNGESPVQSWVIGGRVNEEPKPSGSVSGYSNKVHVRQARDVLEDAWAVGEKAVDAVAEHVMDKEDAENGLEIVKHSSEEQRGKKKKKKKAILKLLVLGAVLKAKIGTLLQILSFKLQVKFFLIALIGLGINLARFWLDLKKSHQQPQKVIYYEHAQHQHHYDHEEEHGWGPWSRSVDPEEPEESEITLQNSPFRGYHRTAQPYSHPTLTRI